MLKDHQFAQETQKIAQQINQEIHASSQDNTTLPKSDKQEKDFWDKLDIIGKIIFAVAVPTLIGIYTARSNEARQKEFTLNKEAEAVLQSLSNRDLQETVIRKDMLKVLVERFFNTNKEEEKILVLELLAINFRYNQFQIKPLFKYMRQNIQDYQNKQKLKTIAQTIALEEINHIIANGGKVCNFEISQGDSLNLNKTNICQKTIAPISLRLLKVEDDYIDVKVYNQPQKYSYKSRISYFDKPFTDHSKTGLTNKIGKKDIYSLVLSETKKLEEKAEIKLVTFPENFYSEEGLRMQIDQLIDDKFLKKPSID